MVLGKSIRIYLKDGSFSGIRQAEVVNHTIQAISCPRKKITDLNHYFSKESNRPGVYFLLGDDDTKTKVYIGEAENVWERIKSHGTLKDFWNEVIIFSSKDENLTKSHVKYLESRLIQIAKGADRYTIENTVNPNLSSLPMADQDSMEDFILNIKLLTGTLGHKFLENLILISESTLIDIPAVKATNPEINNTLNLSDDIKLYLKVKNIRAEAILRDEGIVVLHGSDVSNNIKPFSYQTLRDSLIKEGVISEVSSKLIFIKNYLFKSPSAAAAVIVGYNINGRKEWKNKNGKSLNDIEVAEVA